MEIRNDKLKCPLCGAQCDYRHIVDFHRDFWDNKFPIEQLPADVESFNNRFSMIGLHIEELNND